MVVQYKNLYKYLLGETENWGYNWNQNQQQNQQQQYSQQYSQYNQYSQQYSQYSQYQQYSQYSQYQQYNQYQQQQEEVEEGQEDQQAQEGEEAQAEEEQNQNQQNQQQQQPTWNEWNTTGYASADLKLLSVEYNLFNYLPFNFCGEWVHAGQYNNNPCPYDGTFTFSIPYNLPSDDGDITTWFATGWQGVSDLSIYKDASDSELLASCTMHWKTFVTQVDESEGWKTLPSAAQSAIILTSLLAFMLCCCTYLTCCRRRRRRRHITDADYTPGDDGTEAAPKAEFTLFDDEKTRSAKKKAAKDEMVHKINLSLKEPDWV
jgi:hypothetical protein